MLETSARLLQLLALLQSRGEVTGADAAERLGVTVRTVRRDVDRLRELGYPVDSAPGIAGGYRLAVGANMPPLLLDDAEATAVALALGASAAGALPGLEEPALAALAKLDRVLPSHVRQRIDAVRETTVRMAGTADHVDPQTLITVAQAASANERLRLVYRDADRRESERRVDPYGLVSTGRRWYLVAYDRDRSDWRTLRVDRVVEAVRTGHRFRPEDLDPPDPAELVSRATAVSPYRYAARVEVSLPAEELRKRVPSTVALVEPITAARSLLTTGSDDLDALAGHLIGLGAPFKVRAPRALRQRLREIGESLSRASSR